METKGTNQHQDQPLDRHSGQPLDQQSGQAGGAFKLVGKLLLLAVLVIAVCALINTILPVNMKNYLAALNDKHARIDSLTQAGQSKIIMIGGSNVAFGIDSRMMEKAFEMPVANMAIHAGLRYEYMVNECKEYIGQGDVVLVFPEFAQMFEPLSTGGPIIYQSLEVFPEGRKYCHKGNLYEQLRFASSSRLEILQIKVKRTLGKLAGQSGNLDYKRQVFDSYGDINIEDTKKSKYNSAKQQGERSMSEQADEEISPDFIRLTNALSTYATEQGARVLFLFPAIAEAKWDAEVGANTATLLKQQLDIPIVNDPARYVYANDMFYDTKYHTTQAGRAIRTKSTIEDLKPHF